MSFLDLLRSKTELDVDLIIGDVDMPATFVWGEDSIITDYGIEKYRALMEARYTVLDNGNIEVHCNDYKLGKEFCLTAAGYIELAEYRKIFGH